MWLQMLYPNSGHLVCIRTMTMRMYPPQIKKLCENIIEETQSTDTAPGKPAYNAGKLNFEILRKEQKWDWFFKNKVKDMKKTLEPNILVDSNSFLRKVVKLKYKIEPAIVFPRKLTFIIIAEFSNAKGH